MTVSMIAAVAANGTIGTGHGIPWDLPRDRAHFRRYCADKALLLGRRTFEEMTGWFQPGHLPIVLTRDPQFRHPKAAAAVPDVPSSIAAALLAARSHLVVAGGAGAYAAALPFADELILTEIAADIAGTTKFPEFRPADWTERAADHFPADPENRYAMTIRQLVRRRGKQHRP